MCGHTALYIAAFYGNVALIKHLVEKGGQDGKALLLHHTLDDLPRLNALDAAVSGICKPDRLSDSKSSYTLRSSSEFG